MKTIGKALVLAACGISVVSAQVPDRTQLGLKATEARLASQQAMKAYTWKTRTELQVQGQVKSIRLEMVRYDLDGNQQKTLLSEDKDEPKRKPGLRGKIQERREEAAKDWMADLGQLLHSYLTASKGQMVDFFERASFTPEGQTLRIEGQGFIVPGDRMSYWIEPQQKKPQKMQIDTVHQGDPVRLVVEFQALPDGLNVPARATLNVPDKQVQVKVENFEYKRQ